MMFQATKRDALRHAVLNALVRQGGSGHRNDIRKALREVWDGEMVDHGWLAPVYETIGRVKALLPENVTLLGFCGAPWTLARHTSMFISSPADPVINDLFDAGFIMRMYEDQYQITSAGRTFWLETVEEGYAD